MLPQVLAGLGVVSMASVGCVLWLDASRPYFVATAILALGYQAWLVCRRPAAARTRAMWGLLAASLVANIGVALVWVALSARYR
jgi:hypothetical protein